MSTIAKRMNAPPYTERRYTRVWKFTKKYDRANPLRRVRIRRNREPLSGMLMAILFLDYDASGRFYRMRRIGGTRGESSQRIGRVHTDATRWNDQNLTFPPISTRFPRSRYRSFYISIVSLVGLFSFIFKLRFHRDFRHSPIRSLRYPFRSGRSARGLRYRSVYSNDIYIARCD